MKAANTIEINGRLYDAHTGEPVVKQSKPSQKNAYAKPSAAPAVKTQPKVHQAPTKQAPTTKAHKFVDGVRPNAPGHKTVKPPVKAASGSAPAKNATKPAHARAPHAKTQPKRSTTLHRSGVHAPKISLHSEAPVVLEEESQIVPKTDAKRASRAQHVSRSPIISRFSGAKNNHISEPTAKPATSPMTKHLEKTHSAPAKNAHHTQAASHVIKHAAAAQKIAQHTTGYRRGHGTRFMRYGAGALVFALLAGYVTYLNVPSVSLKVAANRAGFSASLPRTPAGYSLNGPIKYSPGQVTVNFKSNTDERRFSVQQQPTTWDSVALLENYVTKRSANYSTYQDRGLTIYLYDGGNAAWVNEGKLYSVEGKQSQLDATQLLEIAASM